MPKPAFKGSAKPEIDNLAGIGGDTMPAWTVQLQQEEGYYTLLYKTKSSGERISEEHQLRVPLVGEAAIGRRFDDRFHAIETALYNVLVDKNLPVVSVHQMHIEERYRVHAEHSIGPHGLGFDYKSQTKALAVKDKDKPESYSVSYNRTF